MTERTGAHGEAEQRRFLLKGVFSVSSLLRVNPLSPHPRLPRMGRLE